MGELPGHLDPLATLVCSLPFVLSPPPFLLSPPWPGSYAMDILQCFIMQSTLTVFQIATMRPLDVVLLFPVRFWVHLHFFVSIINLSGGRGARLHMLMYAEDRTQKTTN